MRVRWALAATAAALAVAFATAPQLDRDRVEPPVPPAGPGSGQLIGVQLHPFFTDQTSQTVAHELDLAQRAGAEVVRIDLPWSSLQIESAGQFDESYAGRVDSVVNAARRRGLEVIAVLFGTPCWASTAPESSKQGCTGAWWDRGVTAYPPADPERYGIAAAYAARRWGDRLAALEIWNEPNAEVFLRGGHEARDYGAMLRAAYRHVKAVRPRLEVIGGSMALADGPFLEALFDEGGIGGHYDGIAWHPYTDPHSPRARAPRATAEQSFRDGAVLLRRIMRRHGDRHPELWATEAGASTCDPAANARCVSPATQARWIEDYVAVASDMPWLRALIVYNLRDKGTNPADVEHGFGLVRRDFSPKPSFDAFRRAAGGR